MAVMCEIEETDPVNTPNVLSVTVSGLNMALPAGTYWVGLTPTIEFGTLGQEFAWGAGDGFADGAETFAVNPGGGFGLGSAWGPAGTLFGAGIVWDMAIQVTGEVGSCGGGGCVAPASYTVFRGNELSGALGDFGASDDVAARYNPGFTINNLEAPVWLVFDAVAAGTTDFSIESQAGTPGLTYTAEAWNWNTNSYDELGTQDEQFNADQTVTFAITPADHVDGSGNVRARVGWRKTGFTINFPWEVRVDVFNFCN